MSTPSRVVIVLIIFAPSVELEERLVGLDWPKAAPGNTAPSVRAAVPIKKSRRDAAIAKGVRWFMPLIAIVRIWCAPFILCSVVADSAFAVSWLLDASTTAVVTGSDTESRIGNCTLKASAESDL
jgi:hypothetical protein